MKQKKFRFALFVLIFIFSKILLAADAKSEDLKLEEEGFEALPEPTANANLASPLEILQGDNALYGFSIGLVYSMMPLTEKYTTANKTTGVKANIDRQTDLISHVGFILRYAVTPFYKIGTDFNISYLKSQNHNNITIAETKTLGEVTTLKAEFNLTYAVSIGKALPLYFLAGGGVEQVMGGSIEEKLNTNGFGIQAGGGFVVSSTINVEGIYSYYSHRVSNKLVDLNASGSTPVDTDTEGGRILNQGLVVRGSYSFK